METTNQNDQASQGDDLAKLKAFFAKEKAGDAPKKKTLTNEELLAKFFVPRKEQEIFRPLKNVKGRDPIETAYFHDILVNVKNGKKKKKKIYCPKHNDPLVAKTYPNGDPVLDATGKQVFEPAKCALCAKHDAIKATQDNTSLRGVKKEDYTPDQKLISENNIKIFKDSLVYEARKFYIIRGIDRANSGHGVKFWRFKEDFRKQGVWEKLEPVLNNFIKDYGVDYANPEVGCDLLINTSENLYNGYTYRSVSSITTRKQSKLSEDGYIAEQWQNDPLIWRDIFKPMSVLDLTSEQVLDRVARGVNPYWDETDPQNKKWVFPDPADSALQQKANTKKTIEAGNDQTNRPLETASDIAYGVVNSSYEQSMDDMSSDDVGEYDDDAEDLAAQVTVQQPVSESVSQSVPVSTTTPKVEEPVAVESNDDHNNYEDLPF